MDLSQLTIEKIDKYTMITDENRMDIPGFDDMVFQPKAYWNLGSDPMAISFFAGR